MNLDKAITSAGGLILGAGLIILGIFIFAVAKFISQRKKQEKPNPNAKLVTKITAIAGAVILAFSLIYMVATGSTNKVGTLFSTMRSTTQVISNDCLYVKTDFTYNGENDKYTLENAENAITGVSDLKTPKDYNTFDIFVTMDNNVSGSIFVKEGEKADFEKYYTDYENNFTVGATLDKQDSKMTTIKKDATPKLYTELSSNSLKKVSADKVSYSDKISSTKCCIFWAISNDKLVSQQIRIYPKDDNGNYIKALADDEDMIYYEIPSDLTTQLDKYFK
jgi:hypothetical protein